MDMHGWLSGFRNVGNEDSTDGYAWMAFTVTQKETSKIAKVHGRYLDGHSLSMIMILARDLSITVDTLNELGYASTVSC